MKSYKIIEIYGNKKDVIIKFMRKNSGIWYAISDGIKINSPITEDFLKKNNFRRLKKDNFS